ncbi:MAG TPA: HAD family hydrolase [Oceanospirillales bacterium]|nr:HAD family hydrolase [Oceanospirillales bacterium]
MKLKCIIFDVDGTMADTERDGHRVAFNLAFAENGLDWHWDENLYGQLLKVTGGKERMKFYQQSFLNQNILSSTEIKQMHACKTKHYIRLLETGKIPLRTGVKDLIAQAQEQKIRLAISTTTTPINVTTLLKNTLGSESETIFDVIAAGDVVANKKPAPDIYYYALIKLGLKPQHCIAIEDSHAGLVSATAAGIKTIVTTNKYTEKQDFSAAEKIYPDFEQINTQSLNQLIGENHV